MNISSPSPEAIGAQVSPVDLIQNDAILDQLARLCGLVRRQPRKLSPKILLHSLLQAACHLCASTRQLAFLAGLEAGMIIARQSLWERLRQPASSFLSSVLARLLSHQSRAHSLCLPGVKRILVGDSSTLPVHSSLKGAFPGSSNQRSSHACARLQFTFDLLGGQLLHCRVDPFTRVDQAAAKDVLEHLEPGDLLIRDLGYFALDAFAALAAQGCYFLSRWRQATTLFDAKGTPLNLLKLLRSKAKTKPLILEVQTGTKKKVAMRLIAVPLPQAVANERRRRAKADRDKRLNHSQEYYELLSWTLLLTNLPVDCLPADQIATLYAMRWRIENIFKAWKSNLRPQCISTHRTNEHHLRCLLYAQQIVLAIAAQNELLATLQSSADGSRGLPSLFKRLGLLVLRGGLIPSARAQDSRAPLIGLLLEYHGCYEKRKKRISLPQRITRLLS